MQIAPKWIGRNSLNRPKFAVDFLENGRLFCTKHVDYD